LTKGLTIGKNLTFSIVGKDNMKFKITILVSVLLLEAKGVNINFNNIRNVQSRSRIT